MKTAHQAVSEAGATCLLVNPDVAPTSWSRRWTSAEEDVLEGELTVEFAAGQREQVIHIPFVPAFSMAWYTMRSSSVAAARFAASSAARRA